MDIFSLKNLGKKKHSIVYDKCVYCNSTKGLKSFQTMAWFAVFNIPVIPLYKRMVLSYCSKCKSHSNINLKYWEELRNDKLKELNEKIQHNPENPDLIKDYHKTLNQFLLKDDAIKYAEFMEKKFEGNISILIYLAKFYESINREDYALNLYKKGYLINSDNIIIRNKIAADHINNNRADEAAELLIKDDKIIHDSVIDTVLLIAAYYFKNKNYNEAYRFFKLVNQADPYKINNNYRKMVKKIESLLKIKPTILIKKVKDVKKNPLAFLISFGIITIIAFLIFIHMHYAKTIFFVNKTGEVSSVLINNKEYTVNINSIRSITLYGKNYKVKTKVRNLPVKEYEIVLNNDSRGRLFYLNQYIFNINEASVFIFEELLYTPKRWLTTENADNKKYSYKFYLNDFFIPIEDTDFVFQPFPKNLWLSSIESKRKTRFDIIEMPPEKIIEMLEENGIDQDKILTYLEFQLLLKPADDNLINIYFKKAEIFNKKERVKNFADSKIFPLNEHGEYYELYQDLISY